MENQAQKRVTEKSARALLGEKISRIIVMFGRGTTSRDRKVHSHLQIVNTQKEQEESNGVMRNRKAP